jgi:GTP-binding protein
LNIVDRAEIVVKAGNGGDGLASFRHEKFVPLGGPDGGDGGNGGNVYLRAVGNVSNLSVFRYKKVLKAGRGMNGGRQKKHGKNGDDLNIAVPLGTVVYKIDKDERFFIDDLSNHDQQVLVAKGGRGGLGNVHFTTSTNQAPKTSTKGEKGDEVNLVLDLKLIADVGIIGFPNAGKSTLLTASSAAKPRVADYQFTTLEPVLGEVYVGKKNFIMAEIPGLIKGAHFGKGLGHNFLRHAERTKLLVHLLDGSSLTIIDDLSDIEQELALYQLQLAQKHRILAVNKIDIPEVSERIPEIKELLSSVGRTAIFISGATGQGVQELMTVVAEELDQIEEPELEDKAPVKIFHPKPKDMER